MASFRVLTAVFSVTIFVATICYAEKTSKKVISSSASFAYGPGIDQTRSQLPVSYIYVQAIKNDGKGSNYTGSLDNDELKLQFEDGTGSAVAVHAELYNLDRGLSLCRYRVHREADEVMVSIKLHGEHIKSSPFKLGAIRPEHCPCPRHSIKQWLADYQCPLTQEQIDKDLDQFKPTGIQLNNLYKRVSERFPRTSFVHYSIIKNKVYSRTYGDITGFKYLSDMTLLSLTAKVQLPDVELIVNLADWPLDKISSSSSPLPILSWCGSRTTRDILWPTYDIMRGTIQGMDRVSLDILSSQQTRKIPWNQRKTIAFFRGRDSNQARLDLVRQFKNRTDLFDVGITTYFFHHHDKEMYGPTKDRVSFHDFFKYKYQLNIDGTVAAYRLPYLLAGGSLVFKQDSEYYEHFYYQLKPWVHYVPLRQDLSDVEEKVLWAVGNDDKAKKIANNAFQFVVDTLLPDKLYCYLVTLFKEYAKLQDDIPRRYPDMEEVKLEQPAKTTCSTCRLKKSIKEEL